MSRQRLVRTGIPDAGIVQAVARRGNPFSKLKTEEQKPAEKPLQVTGTILQKLQKIFEEVVIPLVTLEMERDTDPIFIFGDGLPINHFEEKCYKKTKNALTAAGIKPTQKDIQEFIIVAMNTYESFAQTHDDTYTIGQAISIFISALVNQSDEEHFTIDVRNFQSGLSSLGYRNRKNVSILVDPFTPAGVGEKMSAGSITIDSYAYSIGARLKGGIIKVTSTRPLTGKVGGQIDGLGTGSTGGTIIFERLTKSDLLNYFLKQPIAKKYKVIGAQIVCSDGALNQDELADIMRRNL